jgi:tetratricopeptide (TPR) repeat protein
VALSILGGVLAIFGVVGFFSVQTKAKKESARVAIEWFETNSNSLRDNIASLQERLDALEVQAKKSIEKNVLSVQAGARDAMQHIQKQMESPIGSASFKSEVTIQSALALAEVAQVAKSKPEQKYSFNDLNSLAFNYYNEDDKASAARYWEKASTYMGASDEEVVDSLLNLGITYSQIGLPKKAISTYDAIIERYLDSDSRHVRLNVARAMLNKGMLLNNIGEHEDERKVYLVFLEWERIHKSDELVEQLSRVKNCLGYLELGDAKKNWSDRILRDEKLHAAYRWFEEALALNPNDSFVIGNLAYSDHLMGASEEKIREKLKLALAIGGEHLYKATFKDFLLNPVTDLDDSFEALLRSEWAKLANNL